VFVVNLRRTRLVLGWVTVCGRVEPATAPGYPSMCKRFENQWKLQSKQAHHAMHSVISQCEMCQAKWYRKGDQNLHYGSGMASLIITVVERRIRTSYSSYCKNTRWKRSCTALSFAIDKDEFVSNLYSVNRNSNRVCFRKHRKIEWNSFLILIYKLHSDFTS